MLFTEGSVWLLCHKGLMGECCRDLPRTSSSWSPPGVKPLNSAQFGWMTRFKKGFHGSNFLSKVINIIGTSANRHMYFHLMPDKYTKQQTSILLFTSFMYFFTQIYRSKDTSYRLLAELVLKQAECPWWGQLRLVLLVTNFYAWNTFKMCFKQEGSYRRKTIVDIWLRCDLDPVWINSKI